MPKITSKSNLTVPPDLAALGEAVRRLDDEPNAAYQAFLIFASLTGSQRNVENVAKRLNLSEGTCRLYQSTYRWLDRASDADAQRFLLDHLARERLQAKDREKFVHENKKIKEKAIRVSNKMLDVAGNLLESADLAGKVVETGHVVDALGNKVPTKTEIHMKAKISDIPRLVDTAVKVARLSAGLSTEIIEPLNDLPVDRNLEDMSAEELEAIRRRNRERMIEKGAVLKGVQSIDHVQ